MKYQLVVRKSFDSIDDLAARLYAMKLIKDIPIDDLSEVKLQRIIDGKTPEGINFEIRKKS